MSTDETQEINEAQEPQARQADNDGGIAPWPLDVKAVREKHPRAVILEMELEGNTYRFAFKRPRKEHLSLAMSSASKALKNLTNLVNSCLIVPDSSVAHAFFQEYPGAPTALGNQLLEAVGVSDAVRVNP